MVHFGLAAGFAALVAGMIALYVHSSSDDKVGRGNPFNPKREAAAEQRRLAARSCSERKWDDCEKALDRAAELDPQGDRADAVTALRTALAEGRRVVDGGR